MAPLKELNTPHKLMMLLEGEALLNDGSSLVCFIFFSQVFRGQAPSIFRLVWDFVAFCVGGPLLGLFFGVLFFVWMRQTMKDGVVLVSLTFVNCFLIFFLCEYLPWNLSGILAIAAAALFQASRGKIEIQANDLWIIVGSVWRFAQFAGESLLYVLTGIFIGREMFRFPSVDFEFFWLIFQIISFFILMNVSRFVMVALFAPFFNSASDKNELKVGVKESIVIAHSGIRGAFSLIICLMVAKTPEYPVHFRHLAFLITITTILLGTVVNGMTVRSLMAYLDIIPPNPIREKWKSITNKDIYNKLSFEIDNMKRKPTFSVASWTNVRMLCGLLDNRKIIDSQELKLKTVEAKISSSNKIFIMETRMRVIAFFRNCVLDSMRDAEFSAKSGKMLIEVSNYSEQETDKPLGLWRFLEEFIKEDYLLKTLGYLIDFPKIEPYVRHTYQRELAFVYETVFSFMKVVEVIIADQTFLENIPEPNICTIQQELEEMKDKSSNYLKELAGQYQIVIQLYQTKRACMELLNKRRKFIKELYMCGIVDDPELERHVNETKKMIASVENFGFSTNNAFIKEILDACIVFSELDEKARAQVYKGYEKKVYLPNQLLFSPGEEAQGMFIVLDGSVEEVFSSGARKIRLFGSIVGVRFFLTEDMTYFNKAKCLTQCTVALFPIAFLKKLIFENPQMEKSVYYMCMLNVLVEKEHQMLSADKMMNMVESFQVHKLKKGVSVEVSNGFVLLKGSTQKRIVADRFNADTFTPGKMAEMIIFDIELNIEHFTYELRAETDSKIVEFKMKDMREMDSIRSASLRQSSDFFNGMEKIQKTYQRMSNFMKMNS